ncbi:MAG: hypothetical protein LH468_03940 [Nocardioides sp.]|nr:hypothetical protein [Nocardioides sp.]
MSRELILPAIRLDVPPRPVGKQVAALAERSTEQWTTSPLAWATQLVTRLAVAQVLAARLRPGPGRVETDALPTDPEQVTLAQLATLFRPHVGLSGQAFQLALLEAVNSGVPAAVDPVHEGLRRVGVTGREPLRMVALGLDKLPPRARASFWATARSSTTVTAVVDALAGGRRGDGRSHDVSGLDRGELARADALLLGGGRMTPVVLSTRPQDGAASWLSVPLSVTRARRSQTRDPQRQGGERAERGVEVTVRGEGWLEVFDTALDAVGSAMQQIDQGGRPRGRAPEQVDGLATRLVSAKDRTVADVCGSLRAIDPFALEMFDHQVTTSAVPVAVPAVEDDLFVQLWLPTSALAGPLFTGAPDLFLGGAPEIRGQVGKPAGRPGGGSPSGRRPGGEARRPRPEGQGEQSGGQPGGRRRKPRPARNGPVPDAPAPPATPATPETPETPETPVTPAPGPPALAPVAPAAPAHEPTPAPERTPATPTPDGSTSAG